MPTEMAERVPQSVTVLETPISIASLTEVVGIFENWLRDRRGRFVVCRDVHGIMRARHDADLRDAHARADLITPDGMPLVWVARLAGRKDASRVCGPDLLPAVCAHGVERQWRHYFYGGAPAVVEELRQELRRTCPDILVVGCESPPYRTLTRDEDELVCANIRAARPHFVWVGLGTPKQEKWMAEHVKELEGAILLGVGAAFDMHAGYVSRAPLWMRSSGLEWLHRLLQEPRRLWRRYLVLAPQFIVLAAAELARHRLRRIKSP
jgi:N-acetylglucosaminyldiphosphoundecaprenol N-acetyl-beta-D-mannosaminyltransferase